MKEKYISKRISVTVNIRYSNCYTTKTIKRGPHDMGDVLYYGRADAC